ncbi:MULTISPECIES: TonB-dependent receptor [unclassified Phenylobacterium]|uniref:TonB-dependent receptor n=1 Tax=unclassified Phenylobacterium TaxID=2640670 RepID=UPI00083A0BDD|nr:MULTISPECIES: TonB-dependent receptor [unclassified Phenylobacterium]
MRLMLLAGVSSAAFAVATAAAAQDRAPTELGEIIVTAQKRAQNLQDVPIAITALEGDALGGLQMASGAEIARQSPNLNVSVLGNEDQPKFAIRGVAQSQFQLNASSPTGVFYDEVFVRSSFLGGAQLYDIQRVEVLRGPQGTLFGKETVGGAVSFITKAPVFGNEGYVAAEYGDNQDYRIDGALNAELVPGKLAARVAFNLAESDGFVKNRFPGGRDKSSIDKTALRASLRYDDGAGFDATLRLFLTRSSPDAVGPITYGFGPGGTNAFGADPRIDPATGARLSAHEGVYDRQGRIRVRGDGAYLTLNKDLGAVTLTSISSYLDGHFLNEVDGDGTGAPLLHLDFVADAKEYSQDLRLATNLAGPFNMIAGLYYFRDELDSVFRILQFGGGFTANQTFRQVRDSYAAYADGTFEATSKLTIYGGLRLTKEKGRLDDFQSIINIPGLGIPSTDLRYSETKPSGRLGLRYQFNPDVMGYAQYARGYRSSGFNGGAVAFPGDLNVAKPEFLDAWEAGLKTELLDRRVLLNLAAFHYKFTDQQFINSISLTETQLVNAGSARLNGLEAELTARITDRVKVNAGVGLLDTKYTKLVLSGIDLSGNRLIESPKLSLNVSADYTAPVGDAGEVLFHGDLAHKSGQYFSAFNRDTFPESLQYAKAFTEVNARIAYRDRAGRYEIGVWGKNLTENEVPTGAGTDQGTATFFTTVPYPRRFGVDASLKF